MKTIVYLCIASLLATPAAATKTGAPSMADDVRENPSPAAVGWGNLLVPGLGATLRDRPLQGLGEAALEIGTFYGGSMLAEESRFKIDGTASIPQTGSVARAVSARMLQQFGLKYHFYNTFHHYQQAVLASEDTEREKSNPQPIYRGDWKDIMAAPFKWDNLSSIWTWPIVLGVGAYLVRDYSRSTVALRKGGYSRLDDALFAANSIAILPFGSSFGEDVLFRGFMQREIHGLTSSLPVAVAAQSALFSLLHSDRITSFLVGAYFGVETHVLKGELGPQMAAHFWINVLIGALDFWTYRRSVGKGAPLNPPVIATQFQIPF